LFFHGGSPWGYKTDWIKFFIHVRVKKIVQHCGRVEPDRLVDPVARQERFVDGDLFQATEMKYKFLIVTVL